MTKLFENRWINNILSALFIGLFGYFFLIITFLFDALYQNIIRKIASYFVYIGPDSLLYWFSPLLHVSFVIIIGIISWFIFNSKLNNIYKATYLIVPVSVILVTIGMFLYRFQMIAYLIGILICASILYFLYKKQQPWFYYYSVILIGFVLAIFNLLGGEI